MPNTRPTAEFYEPLETTIQSLIKNFSSIPTARKAILQELTNFIEAKAKKGKDILLLFVCTHNSRRSLISQIWSQAAAAYFGIENVLSYSGGTEATAFNARAVKAMQDAGFRINAVSEGNNPLYQVQFSDKADPVLTFSKKYDAETNPANGFAAVMTCSHADENCPIVSGMEQRISLPYNDPKDFDGTAEESAKYAERVREIGTEILYAFSQVKV